VKVRIARAVLTAVVFVLLVREMVRERRARRQAGIWVAAQVRGMADDAN
jgi:hypothetical protein